MIEISDNYKSNKILSYIKEHLIFSTLQYKI